MPAMLFAMFSGVMFSKGLTSGLPKSPSTLCMR